MQIKEAVKGLDSMEVPVLCGNRVGQPTSS